MKKINEYAKAHPWICAGALSTFSFFCGMFRDDLHDKILKIFGIAPQLYYSVEEGNGLTCWNNGSRSAEDITFNISWEKPEKGVSLRSPRPVELEGLTQTPHSVGGKVERLLHREDAGKKTTLDLPEELTLACKSKINGVSIVGKGDCKAVELPVPEPKERGLVLE